MQRYEITVIMQNKIVVIINFVAILTHGYAKIKIKIKKYCNFEV